MVANAYKYPGARFLIGRLHLNHAINSIWNDTLKETLKRKPSASYKMNESDHVVRFVNGSEIWITGFDDKERTEKVLGTEYVRIYLNECSQLSYSTHNLVKTRLAQKIEGLSNKMVFDANPPSPLHWLYKTFIKKVEATSNKPLPDPENYVSLLMNPADNVANLPENYISHLESLPEEQRRRFLLGEWVKPEGSIYKEFNSDRHLIAFEDVPPCDYYSVGVDLVTWSAVLVGFKGEEIYIIDEVGGRDITASQLNEAIWERWVEYDPVLYIDHNLGPSGTLEFTNSYLADKGKGSVEAGINLIKQKLEFGLFHMTTQCKYTIYEMENYQRDDLGRIIKQDDHYLDAMRMAIYTESNRDQSVVEYA